MKRSSIVRVLLLVMFLVIPVLLLTANFLRPTGIARGKSAAVPISGKMTPEQEQAQQLALDDAVVMAYTAGHRSEVFGVRSITGGDYPALQASCTNADCRQVEIYNFDENAAVTAVVNLDTETVLDVYYLPGMQPGINKRLADRALEIAFNAPEVISALGYRPTNGTMAPVPAGMLGTACVDGHLCVGPNFKVDDQIFWAIIDLTDDRLAGTFWSYGGLDAPGSSTPFVPEGCPAPGSVDRDGWMLDYETTGTDGLRVYNVTYNGAEVLTSVKLVEWHADYGSGGFEDSTGCGGGGGGFPIYPYGETDVRDLLEGGEGVVGFEVVQDFRMSSWGSSCNYRYEQHIQFYNDGRFRVVSGAYGKGCGDNAIYRPVVRIDIAVDGDDNDNFAYYDGADWIDVTTEEIRVPYPDPDFGQHYTTSENYSWRVSDSSGVGYNIEQDLGQLPVPPPGVPSEGDAPFVYFTQHHPNEGDGDLGIIGDCCFDDERQGPHNYVNGESVVDTNVVLWYVPQMVTDASGPDYYCWTVTGGSNPETYPCFTGPMFHPIGDATPDFAMTTTPATQDICVPDDALYTVSTEGLGGFAGNIDLSAVGNPGTATFVPNPVQAGDPSTLTIDGATAGNYTFDVVGDNGTVQHDNSVSLDVYASAPNAPALLSPPNGGTGVPPSPTYTWNAAVGATSYFIEVATDAGFTNVVDSATTSETSYTGTPLAGNSTYYWRVTADNVCGGNTSAAWSFTTGDQSLACNAAAIGFETGDFPPDWTIETNALPGGEWVVSTDNSSAFWDPGAAPEGIYYASANDDLPGSGSDGSVDYLYTSVIDLSGYTSATLNFWYHFDGTFGHVAGGVEVSGDGGATWDGETVVPIGDTWQQYSLNIDAYAGNNNVQVRFHSDDGGSWAAGYAVDEVALVCEGGGPDIDVDPVSMSSTQNTNTVVVQPLDISNLGTADLGWQIAEVETTFDGGSCDVPVDMPWLSLDPVSGTTSPAGTSTVDVTFDSTGYGAGTYTGDLCIFSNDPDEPLVVVPVEMIVEQPTDVGVSGIGGDVAGGGWLIWLAPVALLAVIILFVTTRQRGKHQQN